MLYDTRNVKKYKRFESEEYGERERDTKCRGRQLREGSRRHRDETGNV
jgi:hypothetical protein